VIKGLIFEVRRFCVNDGPGIRTTVFFKGCPLSCWWCHNPESQDFKSETSIRNLILAGERFQRTEITGTFMSVDEVLKEIAQDQMFYDESGGGVTVSGGEPLMQGPFLSGLLKACKQKGIHTALDTSGYAAPGTFDSIADLPDLFLYDLKLMDSELHKHYTGVSNQSILRNLAALFKKKKNVILRVPIIPGITDTPENIRLMKDFIRSLTTGSMMQTEIHLLPYHSLAKEKYMRFCKQNKLEELPDLKKEDLIPLKAEFESIGGMVSIGG